MKQRKRRKRSFVVLLILLLLLLIVGGFFAYRQCGKRGITLKPEATPMPLDDSAAEWEGEQQLPHVVGEQDFIAIPGCNTLVFSAGETKQKVNFYNPSQNTCLFTMSLLVDGEEVWKSGNVEPSKGFYQIELSHPFEAGTYKGVEHIDCHTPEGQQLNSANVEFDLIVQ